MDKTMMVFGDAKKVIEDMVKAVEEVFPAGAQQECLRIITMALDLGS